MPSLYAHLSMSDNREIISYIKKVNGHNVCIYKVPVHSPYFVKSKHILYKRQNGPCA